MVVFGQKWLCSDTSGCIRVKVVVLGPSDCIRAKVVVFGHSGCIRAKVVIFGQSLLYLG